MICDELPVQQPRYIVISYERVHDDGRLSYPLCLVFYSPPGFCLIIDKKFEIPEKDERQKGLITFTILLVSFFLMVGIFLNIF